MILACGTLKNFRFLLRSCLFTDRAPVTDKTDLFYLPDLTLHHRTYGTPEGCALVLGCTLSPDEVLITDVGHSFVFQNTKDPGLIVHGWEDRYSVRSHPSDSESFFHYCLLWNTLLDSSIFYLREGARHLTGSCRVPTVPYRILLSDTVYPRSSRIYILQYHNNLIESSKRQPIEAPM
jgi:hypothetical protein